KLYVWGACAKSYFVRHGISEERLVVTGSPLFDSLDQQKEIRHELLRRNQLPDKRFILFSSQNFDASKNRALCETTLRAFSQLIKSEQADEKEIALIITLHPARSKHTQETDIETLLSNADTAMYEAKRSHSNCFCKEQKQLRRCMVRDDGAGK
ncbi:MAG: diguanylate cyclase, partial [Gallionella sp.]|nr:diguanylate cyclase [Gallionella sp.]